MYVHTNMTMDRSMLPCFPQTKLITHALHVQGLQESSVLYQLVDY